MRTLNTENIESALTSAKPSSAVSYSSQMTYHEMDIVPVRDVNVLEQLQTNLETLSDLQARMNFMMREIRYLLKV